MPRRARIVCPGLPHHLTHRGNNKETVFHEDYDCNKYIQLLYKFKKDCSCTLHAYCLMGNHVHLLITPKSKEMMAKMVQKIALTYTQYYNTRYKRTGRLWGSRYYSTVVGDSSYLWTVSRYIERNPVRAKMVKRATDYSWSSVYVHSINGKSRLVTPIWKNKKEKISYLEFLNSPDKEADVHKLRQSTLSGKPFGSESFIEKISKKTGIIFVKDTKGRPKNKKNRDTSIF